MDNKVLIAIIVLITFLVVGTTYNFVNEEKHVIYVGYLISNHDAALFVADELEMFEEEGLYVKLVPFDSGADMVEAAASGKIDIGYCGITPVSQAIDKGAPLKVVASVNLEGSGIVTATDTNITNSSDLSNKNVAIPHKGSVQDILLYLYLGNNSSKYSSTNISESEVQIMPLNMESGSIDAYVSWEPFVSLANVYNWSEVMVYSNEIWENHPCCVIIAPDEFIKNKPLALRKFLKVHVKATDYINSHPEKNIEVLTQKMGSLSEVEKESIAHIQYIAIPDNQFKENVLKMVNIEKKMGYIKNNLTYEQIFDLNYLPA